MTLRERIDRAALNRGVDEVLTPRERGMTEALRDIAAMETEFANATVRRMAARARQALGEGE